MIKIDKEQSIEDFIGKTIYHIDKTLGEKKYKIAKIEKIPKEKLGGNIIEVVNAYLTNENETIVVVLYVEKIKNEYFMENRDFRIFSTKKEAIDYKIKEIETEIHILNNHKEYLENLK